MILMFSQTLNKNPLIIFSLCSKWGEESIRISEILSIDYFIENELINLKLIITLSFKLIPSFSKGDASLIWFNLKNVNF